MLEDAAGGAASALGPALALFDYADVCTPLITSLHPKTFSWHTSASRRCCPKGWQIPVRGVDWRTPSKPRICPEVTDAMGCSGRLFVSGDVISCVGFPLICASTSLLLTSYRILKVRPCTFPGGSRGLLVGHQARPRQQGHAQGLHYHSLWRIRRRKPLGCVRSLRQTKGVSGDHRRRVLALPLHCRQLGRVPKETPIRNRKRRVDARGRSKVP